MYTMLLYLEITKHYVLYYNLDFINNDLRVVCFNVLFSQNGNSLLHLAWANSKVDVISYLSYVKNSYNFYNSDRFNHKF